jgi:hypothetical protein
MTISTAQLFRAENRSCEAFGAAGKIPKHMEELQPHKSPLPAYGESKTQIPMFSYTQNSVCLPSILPKNERLL